MLKMTDFRPYFNQVISKGYINNERKIMDGNINVITVSAKLRSLYKSLLSFLFRGIFRGI